MKKDEHHCWVLYTQINGKIFCQKQVNLAKFEKDKNVNFPEGFTTIAKN